jgi:SAM-dependent methyltransferase
LEDLDFIIACHVIEHVANPGKAIVDALSKLKSGGFLVLVIPDKRKTFDASRDLTPVSHLMADFVDPSRLRDFAHFVDFYEKAMRPSSDDLIEELVISNFLANFPIHYHTFTDSSFRRFVRRLRRVTKINFSYWVAPARKSKVDLEFYCVLKRLK